MKKTLIAVLALVAVAACQKNEVICTPDPGAIVFDGAYVDMATRANAAVDPSTTTNSIASFDVWGFMDKPSGKVFEKEKVTKNGGEWTYTNTQYWAPGHKYYFAALSNHADAVVDVTNANVYGLGNIEFTVKNGDQDLLYSAVGPIDAPDEKATSAEPVKFAFNHMLSKVKFTFTNGFTNSLAKIDVKNVKMVVPETADINVNVEDWWSENRWTNYKGTTTVAFGDACSNTAMGVSQECANERIILPAGNDKTYTVTFDVVLYQGDVIAYQGTKTVEIEGVALEIGKAYNFTAELNASNITADGNDLIPIEFTVEEVNDWVQAGAQNGVIKGEISNMTLMTDVEATAIVNLKGTLDGAGHTLSAKDGVNYVKENTARLIEATAPATISNLKIDGKDNVYNGFGIRGIYTIGEGDITIENVEIKNCTYGINANNKGKLTVVNSTISSWNSFGGTTENHFENVTFVPGKDYANFRPYNNTVCMNCEFTGVTIDLSMMVKDAVIKFVNCTVNGQPLTAADFSGLAADCSVIEIEGGYKVIKGVKTVATAEELADALTADDESINVSLKNDIDLPISSLGQITGGSGEYKLGGENTKNITINLNGNKLNVTTTYWSNLGAKNDDAVFTIMNGTMTSSQATGTWNSYDLCFSNCNYVIENVVFEKAIALGSANKSFTLKNVTIKETHDYYAMWIEAVGQNVTIDGLTVESKGRGIKIDEQYVASPARVTLNVKNSTFKTAKKAAILVKTAAGADITLNNVDITATPDADNAVWVDSDSAAYYDLVTVTGGNKKQE
jgi:hypothetical protein